MGDPGILSGRSSAGSDLKTLGILVANMPFSVLLSRKISVANNPV
jgi:hypothetical protein